ncbi:hypothetical protein L596_013748 [Steinernema carpocapsae]|uniref:Antistasin-like domain-containing protein n=1 Tax=Steinernema carpocapsae TaxID=34508 RepID=A0A4U5P267_STECR|nr:hypothetical protein L596_013748 [Steinernema carpocapsae]
MLGLIVMLAVFGIAMADDAPAASTDLRAIPISPCAWVKCAANYHCINGKCVAAKPCECNCPICPIDDCSCFCPLCTAV